MTWYIHPSKQLRDDELPPELVVTNRDGSIEQAYVPETRLYSLEERATCNAWTIRRLKGDNAKLRELLKDMWASMADCHDICATCKHFEDEYEAADGSFGHTGECVFLRRMQELGIEVSS